MDDTDAISLAPATPEDNAVNLPVQGENQQPLPPAVASQRADKTHIGLGEILDKSSQDIYQHYLDGQENMIRKEAATALDFKKAQQRQKDIQDLAAKTGRPLTSEEIAPIIDPSNPNYMFTDPDTVVEKQYAEKYLSTMNTARGYMGQSIIDNAPEIGPHVEATQDDASDLLAKNQYILTRMQNTEQNLVQQQSWPGYLADQAKQAFQPYVEYKERGLIPDSGFLSGIGLGSNLDEQHAVLYRQPFPVFKQQFDAAMDYLEKSNPSMAVSYAKSLLSQNTFESTLNNAFTALQLPDYAGMAVGAAKAVKMVRTLNQVRRAAGDIVQSAARDPAAGPVQASEGVGDTTEAAVQRVARDNTAAVNGTGNPLERAQSTLMSTWQSDAQKFKSNPGTYLSREALTRIEDSFTRDGADLFNRVGTMNRVERTPTVVTDPTAIRAQADKIKQDYKGPANTLLDVEGPVKEPVSNTYWYKSKIGNYDATLFPDEETAEGFARQLGISDPIIKGKAPEEVYIPAAAAKNIETVKQIGGAVRFYMDHGVEVLANPDPQPGYVPYNLKTGKFGPVLDKEATALKQQGLGFYIEKWIPMKENDDLTRDLLIRNTNKELIPEAISSNSASGTKAVVNSLLGWVRNSDETMSVNESAQRKAATYAQSNVQLWAKDLYKSLEDVAAGRIKEDPITGETINPLKVYPKSWFGKLSNRKVAQQFERTLDHARREFDPDTGELGYFFKTPGELQDFYQRNFQRDPSYLETKSYFNYSKLIEGDRMLREVSEFRNRARIGAEQHSVYALDPETGEKISSPFFDGVRLNHFPGGEDYILIMGKNKGDEQLHKLGNINTTALDSMKEKVQQGQAKVIQIYDRDHTPLSNWSEVAKDKLVSYVYTESAESKPIEFNHVARRGGGHFEWDYDHYLKQADIRPQYTQGRQNKLPGVEHMYVGDKTVMPVKNRKLGQDIANIWNQARELAKADKWNEAKPLIQRLGIKWEDWTGWHKPSRDAEGNVVRPMLDLNEPVMVVSKNKKINEMGSELQDRYPKTFRDMTKSGPANNFRVQYNTERAGTILSTINDVGSQGNPIYQYQPAEMVDPLTTMNRALNRAVNSTFMDDYKIYTAEHWLEEAAPYLDASRNELRSSPFYWFNNPKYRSGVDKTIQWNLESNRYKALQFTGIPSKFDTWIHSVTSELADKFYEKRGPAVLGKETFWNAVKNPRTILPIYMLHRVTDPVSALRSLTFNFKLGLFAIPQFIVQAQTHALIWALEPRHGTVGTYSMFLHNWGKFVNPAVLSTLDDYATKLNMLGSKWRPGEWLEARRELEKTGFEHVAGEYSNINNQLKTKFIKNDFDNFLQAGQFPFRMGEQSNRITAWYTAFREFRDANPTTPITNIERSKILNKADLLTVNMSRASSSMLNESVFSLSTQFLTYQIKLAELFLGKRLADTAGQRWAARARILTFFTALYGLPNALGVTGAPIADNIRSSMMDGLGYIPGEKWYSTMVNEGLPAWTLAMITGKLPNVGDRYGSQGFQNIKQFLRGDISWWQAVGGAGVTTASNVLSEALDPFTNFARSWVYGQGDFKIKAADLVEPFKEISSISAGTKAWAAIQTGKWINKNGDPITDVTPLQTALYTLTGMSPQEQDDWYTQNQMVQGERDAKKYAKKMFLIDWRRGIEAKSNGDSEQGNDFFRNAMSRATVAGMSPEEINTAIAIGNRGHENLIDQSDINMWKNGDYNKTDERIQQYKRKLDMKDQGAR